MTSNIGYNSTLELQFIVIPNSNDRILYHAVWLYFSPHSGRKTLLTKVQINYFTF